MAERIDLASGPLAVHIVGIGGAGMSAIATVLAAMGHRVSGSDLKTSARLERLRALGVEVAVGHAVENVGQVDSWPLSTAIPTPTQKSVSPTSAASGVVSRAEILAAIVATKRAVAVAGTHGKTTTSSMLALVLMEAGLQPSFIVGGELNEIGTGAVWDSRGDLLVVEADESDGTFLELPAAAVRPHQRRARPPRALRVVRVAGARVRAVRRAGPRASRRVRRRPARRPARRAPPRDHLRHERSGRLPHGRRLDRSRRSAFTLRAPSDRAWTVALPVPGLHNARNAAGAMAMAIELGATPEAAVRRARSLCGRGPALRAPRIRRRRDVRRRLRPPAERGRSCARSGAGGRLEPGRLRVPAAPLQPHGELVAGLRRRVRRRRRARDHRRLLRRRGAAPWRHRQARRERRARRPSAAAGRVAAAPCRPRRLPRERSCGRGTSASPWAPATSRPCRMCWSRSSS